MSKDKGRNRLSDFALQCFKASSVQPNVSGPAGIANEAEARRLGERGLLGAARDIEPAGTLLERAQVEVPADEQQRPGDHAQLVAELQAAEARRDGP